MYMSLGPLTSWEDVLTYHEQHGDDYGSESSRQAKYDAILSMSGFTGRTVLDVGCGEGRFRDRLPPNCQYTGIDLLEGQNALGYPIHHDIVVANGLLYKIPRHEGWQLLRHLWGLAREALIFTALRVGDPGETTWPESSLLAFALAHTDKVALRTDYLPHDFCVAMYR